MIYVPILLNVFLYVRLNFGCVNVCACKLVELVCKFCAELVWFSGRSVLMEIESNVIALFGC